MFFKGYGAVQATGNSGKSSGIFLLNCVYFD